MKRRGLTLFELVMTISLAALMVGGTLLAMRKPMAQAGSRAVAEQVAEFLRGARQQALAEQLPVAVLLPTEDGANPCSQSVALARGESQPQITRVLNFARENPTTVLFVGTYPSTGTWTLDAPDLAETNFWGAGYGPADPPLVRWVNTRRDFVFLFTPRGSVLTNNIPNLNGSYRIVVAQGVATGVSAATGSGLTLAAPPPSAGLTAAADPYLITLSGAGAVTVEPGPAGVASDHSFPVHAAPPLAVTAPPDDDPTITDIELFPPPGVEAADLGVSATLPRDRQMTIRVRATIPSSEDLYCNVTVTGVDAAGNPVTNTGSLSSPGAKRMAWRPQISGPIPVPGHWVTEWQWLPPSGLLGQGELFTIIAQVKTRRGTIVSSLSTPALVKTVKMFDKGRIYFAGVDPYTNKLEVFMVRADGSDLTRVTHEEPSNGQHSPTATRDGNKLLFTSVNMTAPATSDLYALSRLGGLSTRVTGSPNPDPASNPSFSDDSTVAVFENYPGGFSVLPEFWAFDPNGLWPPPRLKMYDSPVGSDIGIEEPVISPAPSPGLTGALPPIFAPGDPRRACWRRRAAFVSDFGDNPGDPPREQRAIYTALFALPATSPADRNLACIPKAQANIRRVSSPGPNHEDHTPVFSPDPIHGRLAFIREGPSGRRVYVTQNLTGPPGGEFVVSGSLNDCWDPCYCPDGSALVFSARVGGVWDLYTIPLDPDNDYLTPLGPPRALGTPGLLPFTAGFTEIKHPSWSL